MSLTLSQSKLYGPIAGNKKLSSWFRCMKWAGSLCYDSISTFPLQFDWRVGFGCAGTVDECLLPNQQSALVCVTFSALPRPRWKKKKWAPETRNKWFDNSLIVIEDILGPIWTKWILNNWQFMQKHSPISVLWAPKVKFLGNGLIKTLCMTWCQYKFNFCIVTCFDFSPSVLSLISPSRATNSDILFPLVRFVHCSTITMRS